MVSAIMAWAVMGLWPSSTVRTMKWIICLTRMTKQQEIKYQVHAQTWLGVQAQGVRTALSFAGMQFQSSTRSNAVQSPSK